MIMILKWAVAVIIAGLLWLVGVYTDEYFRPYKKVGTTSRKR